MLKLNLTQQKYTENHTNIQLVMPINFEICIPKDDSVRLLSQIVEGLNFKELNLAYSSKGRNPAVPPRILFQILVYAYMNCIYSSRKIEKACKRDINFMWLLEGYPAPDHSTIARFRSRRMEEAIEDLFNQLVTKLHDMGEMQFENLFVDGTKIESAANKYTFVWKKAVSKNENKLAVKAADLFSEINKNYNTEFSVSEDIEGTLSKALSYLADRKESEKIDFVKGIGKRKTDLQKYTEQTEELLSRQQKYNRYNSLFDGRNSFSKTDPDATFMHMKDDHMRNAQLKPGYNIQIGVEGGYIAGIDISSERSDSLTLIPFLKKLENSFKERYKNIIADAGYESEENYLYLEQQGQVAYIKPMIYEQWKKKSFSKLINKRENMEYDQDKDEYICNQKRRLVNVGNSKRKSKSGYESEITYYECECCENCPVKSKCTKAKGNRRLEVSKVFIEKRAASWTNIMTPKGITLRMNRSIQVEGAFGIMKEDMGFRRFLTRGKKNVKVEWNLLCFGYNINRLHRKIQEKNTGKLLYEREAA